jgi:hypothetical protein
MMAAASKSAAAAAAKSDVFDPLRSMAATSKQEAAAAVTAKVISTIENVSFGEVKSTLPDASTPVSSTSKQTGVLDGYEPWRDKRAPILTKYTTNKKIPVQANFLEEEKVAAPKAVDSARGRLEELEAEAEIAQAEGGKISMTQKEYITHIEEQHEKLKLAWEAGERVTSLKIGIQCAKLLGDCTVPSFYPSMYVLLTDILDTFGDLVFERIKRKGIDVINQQTKVKTAVSLPVNFKHTDVSASAQETCRNWFYKTACQFAAQSVCLVPSLSADR